MRVSIQKVAIRLGVAVLTSAAVALSGSSASAGVPNVSATVRPAAARVGGHLDPLTPLVELAAQRALLGDKVAAAKFGTSAPIDDPAREQQVLDRVASLSIVMGLDPVVSVRFFRQQIAANKIVQRGLYSLWIEHPELIPSVRPDLATEVRPVLDQITTRILDQLLATVPVRGATRACVFQLAAAARTTTRNHHLDQLHRDALRTALVSVCA